MIIYFLFCVNEPRYIHVHFISVTSHVIAAAFGIVLDNLLHLAERKEIFALVYWAYTVNVMYAMIAFAVYVF